jgi:hypothetical protein
MCRKALPQAGEAGHFQIFLPFKLCNSLDFANKTP